MQIDYDKFMNSPDYATLRAYAKNVAKDPDVAEDIIQTAFLRAIRTDGWNPEKGTPLVYLKLLVWSSFKDWLDYQKARGIEKEVSLTGLTVSETVPDPDTKQAGTRLDIRTCLRKVSRSDRKLLRLRYIKGYTLAEIAVKVGKKPTDKAWVRWRINRALRILRRAFGQGDRTLKETPRPV